MDLVRFFSCTPKGSKSIGPSEYRLGQGDAIECVRFGNLMRGSSLQDGCDSLFEFVQIESLQRKALHNETSLQAFRRVPSPEDHGGNFSDDPS